MNFKYHYYNDKCKTEDGPLAIEPHGSPVFRLKVLQSFVRFKVQIAVQTSRLKFVCDLSATSDHLGQFGFICLDQSSVPIDPYTELFET